MLVVNNSLESLLGELGPWISKEDLADISNFLFKEVLGSDPSAELIETVMDFVRLRIQYWKCRRGETEKYVSSTDIHFAIKQSVNAGARKDRVLGMATKLSRALERVGK